MAQQDQHLAELLKLPPVERMEAANALFDSLENDATGDWEAAWSEELRHRLDGLADGSRTPLEASAVLDEAKERLQRSGR